MLKKSFICKLIFVKYFICFLFYFINHISFLFAQCTDGQIIFESQGCPSNTYSKLVFEENFNSNDLDPLIWSKQYPWGKSTGFAVAEPENLQILNGKLLIYAKEEDKYEYGKNYCDNGSSDIINCIQDDGITNFRQYKFTTGLIYSNQAFSFGKFEIMCKIPNIDGVWPTFWLFEGDPQTTSQEEIDIFDGFWNESINEDPSEGNKRLNYGWILNTEGCKRGGKYYSLEDLSTEFHKYSITWDEYRIVWYLDDNEIGRFSHYTNMAGQDVYCEDMASGNYIPLHYPTHPLNIVVNLQMKNFCEGATSDCPCDDCSRGDYPSSFEIDYIKVWERENGCCKDYKYYEDTDNLPNMTQVNNFIVAGNNCVLENDNGDVIVQPGQNVIFRAGDQIELLPGFNVENGSTFFAEMQDCDLNSTGSDEIVINNIPDEFSPDGDGVDDIFCVSVNNATSYRIYVDDWNFPNTRYYAHENVQITSDPICIWDGNCEINCGLYHKCNRKRTIHLTLYNCDHTLVETKDIYVSCDNTKIINDSIYDNVKPDSSFQEINDQSMTASYFRLSPNPCSGQAIVEYSTTGEENISLEFYNFTGNKIKELTFSGGQNTKVIDLSDFSNGIYSYRINIGQNLLYADKIVVIK